MGSVENSTAVSLLLVAHTYRIVLSRYRHETSLVHYCCCWMRDLQGGGGRLFYRAAVTYQISKKKIIQILLLLLSFVLIGELLQNLG